MRAAIISLGSISSQMIAEALQKYFDHVDAIQLRDVEVSLGKEGGIFYGGKKLENYDCVYLKGSFRYANLLRSIAALLEGRVPYMPLSTPSFTIVHNKLLTHLVLQQYHIPMPRTYVLPTVKASKELLKRVNFPIVMKFPEGTQGKGVMFADSISSASSLLDALGALKQPFIIQEYVETGGVDIRALVVGGKVIAAMKRTAQTEEKRANIHAGGTGEPVQLNRETIKIALDTAQALGADICGVDILESPLGPLVVEANISPGLQGLQKVSTLNVADEIAKFFHRKTEEVLGADKKKSMDKVMKEIDAANGKEQHLVSHLQFRGDKIILPEIVGIVSKFNDRSEYSIKVRKGRVTVEEL